MNTETATSVMAPDLTGMAIAGVRRVDARLAELERGFGHARLVNLVNGFPASQVTHHIRDYRRIIRENEWPNSQFGYSPTNFVEHFIAAASRYVEVAFSAAEWLADPSGATLEQQHRLVLASEAARGRAGKSAPDGLDARLDRAEDELANYVDDDGIVLLGSIPDKVATAETALVKDLQQLRAELPCRPGPSDHRACDPDSLHGRYLRIHCKWRTDRFDHLWTSLDGSVLTPIAATDAPREALLRELPLRARQLADEIVALNILNLVLEPAASFKGGPGLLHAVVFRRAEHLAPTPMARQLVLDREDLLAVSPIA